MGFVVSLAVVAAGLYGLVVLVAYPKAAIGWSIVIGSAYVGFELFGVVGTVAGLIVGVMIVVIPILVWEAVFPKKTSPRPPERLQRDPSDP